MESNKSIELRGAAILHESLTPEASAVLRQLVEIGVSPEIAFELVIKDFGGIFFGIRFMYFSPGASFGCQWTFW